MLIAGASVSSKMNARRTNNPPLFETLLKDSIWHASRSAIWKRDATSEKETIDIRASPRLDALQTNESCVCLCKIKEKQERRLLSVGIGWAPFDRTLQLARDLFSIGCFFRFFADAVISCFPKGHSYAVDLKNLTDASILCSESINIATERFEGRTLLHMVRCW